ncbi:MAG: helix-hairpin-helix domain-containing protein, partial [Candidatus Eremiobacteraeota bacterium]|nr:helix-hairpin-helix domain-containing protein [Candidatus Eremiobacteraeota bacterium]
MELRKPLVLVIIAAAGGAAIARAMPTTLPPSASASFPRAPSWRNAAGDLNVVSGVSGGDDDRVRAERPASARGRYGVASMTAGGDRSSRSAPFSGLNAVVYVAGEVVHPGVYTLAGTARAIDALHAAGGPTHSADIVAVNLAQRIEDGAEIFVPAKGAVPPDAVAAGEMDAGIAGRSRSRASHHRKRRKGTRNRAYAEPTASGPTSRVSLNDAGAAEFETLPGIGPALADRIVTFREVNGPFASIDELLDVSGMTQSKVDALTP